LLFPLFLLIIWFIGTLIFGIVSGIISIIVGLIGIVIKTFLKKYNAKRAIECAQQYKGKIISTQLEALKVAENILIFFHKINQESAIILFLDRDNYCKEIKVYFGDEYSVTLPREDILRTVNSINTSKLVIIHNHPDEKPAPSDQDIMFTIDLQNAFGNEVKIVDALVWCKGGIKSILNTHRFRQMIKNY